MFIGREHELLKLNRQYDSGKFECVVVYGRRRVGKTTLINEFIKDKKAIYFTGLETDSRENLANLSQSIMQTVFKELDANPVFADYQSAFKHVFQIAKRERLVLIIDEYPYLAESYPGISSLLQVQIDENKQDSLLMIVLCGSSMSFMENQVLGYQSPLYGRRTAQYKIEAFDFNTSRLYFPDSNLLDQACLYGITGGIPQYLGFMNKTLSVEENILNNFLDPNAYLYEEPNNLLKQEVRDPAGYNSILQAIATGSSRVSEISTKTQMHSSAVTSYLNNLIALGIIIKETPITEKAVSRKTIYRIGDSMFRFWYRFIPKHASLIQNNMAMFALKNIVAQLPDFMGEVFERICGQWLWEQNVAAKLPLTFLSLGRWWGNDRILRRQAEIDILALSDESAALFAECKWTNEKIDVSVLDTLMHRAELFSYEQKHLYLFAKSGFTDGCIKKAKLVAAHLIKFTDMFNT